MALVSSLEGLEATEAGLEGVPVLPFRFGVAFADFVEGELVHQLRDPGPFDGGGRVFFVGDVGVEELRQDLGLDGVDDRGGDGQPAELARLAQRLADDGEELVLDAVVGAAVVVGGDVLPARAVLPVELKQLEVLLCAPLLPRKVGVEMMVPPG